MCWYFVWMRQFFLTLDEVDIIYVFTWIYTQVKLESENNLLQTLRYYFIRAEIQIN